MRIHTVASLSVLGMGLTSFAVWTLAPARAAPSTAAVTAEADAPAANAPAAVDRSQFQAGATLTLEGRIGHPTIPRNRDQSTFVLATVKGATTTGAPASPLDLTIVIDTSGSMRGSKLVNAIEGARGMIRRMRDGDRVSIVTYSSTAQVLLPSTSIDAVSRERAIASLANISAMGETCISCALDLAMAFSRPQLGHVSRILLLSDGEATAGVRDVFGFQRIAARCRAMDTAVSTVGVDLEYDVAVMSSLAQFSNGQHYFVDDPSGLPPVFDRELDSLSRTVASSAQLVVELADGVQVEQVFDREVQRVGNRLVVPVGTVGPGEEKTFLVGVRVPAGADPEREIASIQLTYQDLVTHNPGDCHGALAARTTTNAGEVSELDSFVAARMSRSETAQAIREANQMMENGQFSQAQQRLSQAAGTVRMNSAMAGRNAPTPMRPMITDDFARQQSALEQAQMGLDSPDLAAPPTSAAGAEARHAMRHRSRANAEMANPFSL